MESDINSAVYDDPRTGASSGIIRRVGWRQDAIQIDRVEAGDFDCKVGLDKELHVDFRREVTR